MASRYRATLEAISQRTNTSLPSLVLSFGILHEVTAIAPLFGVFYTVRYFGLGEQVVETLSTSESTSWVSEKARTYMTEGERRVERVGRRYGIFGYEKRDPEAPKESAESGPPSGLAGNIANMALAYAVTKVCGPVSWAWYVRN